MKNKLLPLFDFFLNLLHNSNALEKDYNGFENLVQSGFSREQALAKVRLETVLPTGPENYAYLQNVWDIENMQPFADFLEWYNKKGVVKTLEAMHKMVEF